MSEYNRPKTFQIPDICFRNRPDLQYKKDRTAQLNLRETIDTSSLMYNQYKGSNKYKPSFTESLRHTTQYNSSLTDLLGKSNKELQAKTAKQKYSQYRKSTFDDIKTQSNTSRIRPSNYTMNSTWSDFKHKSYKDLSNIQKQEINILDRQMKQKYLYNSNSYKDAIEAKQLINSPNRKSSQTDESPLLFSKKPSYYYSPSEFQTKEDYLQTASTKFGSPMSCKQIKQNESQLKSPTSFTVIRKKSIVPSFLSAPKLEDFYIIKHLGEGRFGAVSMATHKRSGLLVAIKKVKKQVIKANKIQNQFVMQLKMQLIFKHANVLRMYGYFDDQQYIYLILEYMQQGTLYGQLKKQKRLSQKDTARKMADVLNGVQYLHDMDIAHRDIKPQNIVLSNGVCKICDFGWAAKCDNRRTTLCGTIDYAPPQVLQGKQYGISIDLWCLGVLCYQLLVGKAPFYHVSRKQTMQKIIKADTNDLKIPQNISESAIDFINKLLLKNPEQRMTCQQALRHKFILQNLDEDNENLRAKKK